MYNRLSKLKLKPKLKERKVYGGLKFLVRLSNDMELPERQEYASKLKKAEKFRDLKDQQRNSPSDQKISAHSRPASSRGSLRTGTGSGKRENSKKQDDSHYSDPLGPTPNNYNRLKTGVYRGGVGGKSIKIEDDDFVNEELGDDLLPE
uniref:Uncharacterized protein n=1 Tax=Romanomermis culicivorax TaxID=13658 RepID=A0A915HEQ6_ROMCU